MFSFKDFLETSHGFFARDEFSGPAGKGFGNEEWLGEETLDFSRPLEIGRAHVLTPLTFPSPIPSSFFLNDPAPPKLSPLPLHDALPIYFPGRPVKASATKNGWERKRWIFLARS